MAPFRPKRSIPANPADLSPGWLTDQLRSAGALAADNSVVGFSLSTPGGGTGMSGEVVRVELRYASEPGGPASVIAKFPTSDLSNRGMMEITGAYEREIHFYRDFAGTLPVKAPGFFGADMDPGPPRAVSERTNRAVEKLPPGVHVTITKDITKFAKATKRRYALLIEDFGDGLQVHDLADPPPAKRLATALDALAEVHAKFWGDSKLATHDAFWPMVTQTPRLQSNVFSRAALDAAVDRYNLGDAESQRICAQAGDRYVADTERLNRPITLVHGDPRSDNLLFASDTEVAIVDWAVIGYADPGYDVGYLLSSSVLPEAGRTQAEELAHGYHQALERRGVSHPFDDLWESVEAMCRCIVVQQTLSLRYMHGDYGEAGLLSDLWLPRAMAILRE